MSVHIAILRRPYLDAVLAGDKTVESRLTRTATPPWGQIQSGDRIFLKQSGGPFRAVAQAGHVESQDELTPATVDRLRRRFAARVGGDDAYWTAKRDARYACFIELCDVAAIPNVGPAYKPQYLRAWYVLPDAADPIRDVALTAGAIRNRYVSIKGSTRPLREAAVRLEMPDEEIVVTELVKSGQLRWRGWARYFDAYGVEPGHRVRLLAMGGRRYRVSFPDAP